MCRRDENAWDEGSTTKPYAVSRTPVPCDVPMQQHLEHALGEALGPANVVHGLNCTACSFYSSQGRVSTMFDDRNEGSSVSSLSARGCVFIDRRCRLDRHDCGGASGRHLD